MLRIYNNTNTPITCDIHTLEVGINFIEQKTWASYSQMPAIAELIKNCSLLVDNHEDYFLYKSNIDFLFGIVTSNETMAWIKSTTDKEQKLKMAQDQLKSIEVAFIELEIFHDDFAQDIKTSQKHDLIHKSIDGVKKELNKIIKECEK